MGEGDGGGKDAGRAPRPTLMHLARMKENRPVVAKFIRFTLAMVCLPLLTFYAFRDYAVELLFPDMSASHQLAMCAVAAVAMVNVVSVAYVIVALREKDERIPENKKSE